MLSEAPGSLDPLEQLNLPSASQPIKYGEVVHGAANIASRQIMGPWGGGVIDKREKMEENDHADGHKDKSHGRQLDPSSLTAFLSPLSV